MAVRSRKTKTRKPFWERVTELFLSAMKRLLIPALLIWLFAWLWLGGVFNATATWIWGEFVVWTGQQGLVVEDVVINGRDRTDLKALNQAINVSQDDPILSVNVQTIRQNIKKMPWVGDVMVSRHYSGLVVIDIVERIPFVLWDRPGLGKVVVDTKGHMIESANPESFSQLLLVRGVGAPQYTVELMQMILVEPEVAKYIQGGEWIGDRRWDLLTVKGTRIHLPEGDIGYALARLAKIQDDKNILKHPLLSIDLRASDRIIIETERGQSQDIMNLSSLTQTDTI